MERVMPLLLPALLVLLVACGFFSIQPWVPGSGVDRWVVIGLRGGEVMALYVLAHGLWIWCNEKADRWPKVTRACLILGLVLLLNAVLGYVAIKRSMDSPLMPSYLIAQFQGPKQWRMILGLAIVLSSIVGWLLRSHRVVLIVTTVLVVLYWLAPELHQWQSPSRGSMMIDLWEDHALPNNAQDPE